MIPATCDTAVCDAVSLVTRLSHWVKTKLTKKVDRHPAVSECMRKQVVEFRSDAFTKDFKVFNNGIADLWIENFLVNLTQSGIYGPGPNRSVRDQIGLSILVRVFLITVKSLRHSSGFRSCFLDDLNRKWIIGPWILEKKDRKFRIFVYWRTSEPFLSPFIMLIHCNLVLRCFEKIENPEKSLDWG